MADQTLLYNELLRMPNLRAKTYTVEEPTSRHACINISARRLENWYFARRWVSTQTGRSVLYGVLEKAETSGWRFQVSTRAAPHGPVEPRPWANAKTVLRDLSEDERRIHDVLFPEESRLIMMGYDWNHEGVSLNGVILERDEEGRVLEERDGLVYEWVKVTDEYTWRRFPIHRVNQTVMGGRSG